MALVLAADIGSSNLKAGLIDHRGRLLALHEEPIALLRPEEGACEHDPDRIFKALRRASRSLCARAPGPVKALCLSAYNLNLLCLDSRLRPLGGVITLMDTRSQETFAALEKSCDAARIYRLTGSPLFPQTLLARLHWLRRRRPSRFRRAAHFLSLKDYLVARLSGRLCCELSTASASQLLNIRTLRWEPYALGLAGVKESQLPPLLEGGASLGPLSRPVCAAWGLAPGALLLPGLYDGGASALGLGALLGPGLGVVNFGTSAMLRVVTPRPVWDLAASAAFQAYYLCEGRWFVGSGINNAGSAVQWLSGGFLHAPLQDLESEASAVPPGSDGVIVVPRLGPERSPLFEGPASASILGLTRGSGRGHVYRALLEGISFMLYRLLGSLSSRGVRIRELRLSGAASSSPLWRGILAAMLGRPVRFSPGAQQPGLLGSAMLAFRALGLYPSLAKASQAMAALPAIRPSQPALRKAYPGLWVRLARAHRLN